MRVIGLAVIVAVGLILAPLAAKSTQTTAQELPNDAEMIAHFKAHRKQFDELVRLYQTDERRNTVGNRQPFWTAQYTELLKRAGIEHLGEDGALWLPDPYSKETAKKMAGRPDSVDDASPSFPLPIAMGPRPVTAAQEPGSRPLRGEGPQRSRLAARPMARARIPKGKLDLCSREWLRRSSGPQSQEVS
ncbi:MAG: hypothetical protein ACRELZ_04410 [Candidatus Rokuibacteriota bacterium]